MAGKFSNSNSPSIKKRIISKYFDGAQNKKLIQPPHPHPIFNSINAIEFTGNSRPHSPIPVVQYSITPTAIQDGRNSAKLDQQSALFLPKASVGDKKQITAGEFSQLYRSHFSDGTSHLSSILDPQNNAGINSDQIMSIQATGSSANIQSSTPHSIMHRTPQPLIPPISEKRFTELIPTQQSPQASPMLHQRVLPDSKFHSFGLLQSKNNMVDSNTLELRLAENLNNELEEQQNEKKCWRPQELISPNFSYSKDTRHTHGLPTATFDSNNNKSLSSGKNSETVNNQMRIKMKRIDQNQKGLKQKIHNQSVEAIKKGQSKLETKLRNKNVIKQAYIQNRVPLSLSSFQLQPLERLDYFEIDQLIEQSQPLCAQLPNTVHHSKKSSFNFNNLNYQNNHPISKPSKGQNAALKRNSQIPPKIKRPFIGSKNLAAPVAPQDLSPYSSKHGRITKRSAGAWCQFPHSMLNQEERMRINSAAATGSGKVIWGFYSGGEQEWSKKLKQADFTAPSAQINKCQEKNGKEINERQGSGVISQRCTQNSRRTMSTPQQRHKTIAIKMKTVAYDNTDSVTTSKDFGAIPTSTGALNTRHIGNMRGSLSQDLLKSRIHNSSFTEANLVSSKTLQTYLQQHDIQNRKPNDIISSSSLVFQGKQLSRSATNSLSKLKKLGNETPGKKSVRTKKKKMKSRAKSTTFISSIYQQPVVVVEEEPFQQADYTSRYNHRSGSIA